MTGYRFLAVRRDELMGYFVWFGHPILFFAYFIVKTKAYNVIISHTVQLWLLSKTVLSFRLNSIVKQYNILAKFGTFFMIHPVSFIFSLTVVTCDLTSDICGHEYQSFVVVLICTRVQLIYCQHVCLLRTDIYSCQAIYSLNRVNRTIFLIAH